MAGMNHLNSIDWKRIPGQILTNRGLVTSLILLVALVGFEMFNYSTTFVALGDLLGETTFLGFRWSAILAIAFCAIDFAGIARIFMPDEESHLPKELWFLFGAWLLAASMNATLTWWGVSMTINSHAMKSSAIIDPNTLTHIVPIFVAMMVWVTRILLIGTFSFSGRRFLRLALPEVQESRPAYVPRERTQQVLEPAQVVRAQTNLQRPASRPRPASVAARPSAAAQRASVPLAPSQRAANPAANYHAEPEYIPEPGFGAQQPAFHHLSGSTSQPKAPRF